MTAIWIPEETPVLESVFVSHAPNADEIASQDGAKGIFDSLRGDDLDAIEEAVWEQLDTLSGIAYRAGLARLRAWQLAEIDYELYEL